ncbi:MAG: OmpA family protein [Deltaproteobacteria bacterium]|nr:OmpA family protein [Deltaproteobacteria bacterium]
MRTCLATLLAVALLPLGACVTQRRVFDETEAIYQKLLALDEHAFYCAPRSYAMTRSNADFARWEAMQGDSFRAKKHLEASHAWMARIMEEAFNPDGSFREGCEGDQDHDGVLNSKDGCPTEPEDCDGDQDQDGCPEFDKDGDGISDEADRCPLVPEDKDGFEDTDGCPETDNDLDGIPDEQDKCRNQPEDFDQFEDQDGCPENDNDGDGILDGADKCPNEPEDKDGDQDEDGCPDLYKNIVIKDKKIELRQKIFFAFNKATILPQSFGLLDEVATALADRAEIRVRIEGHTDDKGSDKYNRKLSDDRAKSVRMYLIKKGVDPSRMVAIGFGEEKPIAGNDTDEGRELNRRVEFFILDQNE